MNKYSQRILGKYIKDIYLKNNKKMSVVIFILSILKSGCVLVPPIYIVKVMDEAIPENNGRKIVLYISILILFTILDVVFGIYIEKLYNELGKKVCIQYQKQCLEHMFRLEGSCLSNSHIGEKFITIMSDVSQIKVLTSSIVFDFVLDIITAIVMMIFLVHIQADMLFIVLCILPIIYLSQRYFQKKGLEKANKARDSQSALADILETIVSNTFSCILCNGQYFFFKKYDEKIREAEDQTNDLKIVYAKSGGVLNFLSALYTIVILSIGGFRVMKHTLSIGGLIAFNMYVQKLVIPVLKISNVLMNLQGVVVSLERLESFMKEPEVESGSLKPEVRMKKENNDLSFEKVFFSYEEKPVLKGISMRFRVNKLNVIVGESGCGKSTLTLMLYRIWNMQSGTIRIDGRDYKDYAIQDLRNNISLVGQDAFLFNDTILNNIVMNEEIDTDKVVQCCKIACIHDFVMSLPKKYESFVGDRGVKLSGGEKQRICLARALLKNNSILVLDEATSALDQLTERRVLNNLVKYTRGKILVLITHRLNSIVDADNIHVLKDGEVVDEGSHMELMQKSTYYRKIFEHNTSLE